jgi:hypothetical protein
MQTSLHSRVIDLCERLVEATLAGEAEWRGEGEDRFVWGHEAGSVLIAARDRDGMPPYELSVMNPMGEKVEELASALLEDDQPAPWNGPLAELYRAARRSGLHADDIIEALVAALPSRTADQIDDAVAVEPPAVDTPAVKPPAD